MGMTNYKKKETKVKKLLSSMLAGIQVTCSVCHNVDIAVLTEQYRVWIYSSLEVMSIQAFGE